MPEGGQITLRVNHCLTLWATSGKQAYHLLSISDIHYDVSLTESHDQENGGHRFFWREEFCRLSSNK